MSEMGLGEAFLTFLLAVFLIRLLAIFMSGGDEHEPETKTRRMVRKNKDNKGFKNLFRSVVQTETDERK